MPQSAYDPRSQEHQRRHRGFLVADLDVDFKCKFVKTSVKRRNCYDTYQWPFQWPQNIWVEYNDTEIYGTGCSLNIVFIS